MKRSRKLGVRELAEELGLSFSTVAAALRGSRLVRRDTRERVLAWAARRGYHRDAAAALLAGRRSELREDMLITVVRMRTSPQPEVRLKLLSSAAAERGYRCREICADDVAALRRAGRTLFHQGAEAIVLGRMPLTAATAVGLQHFCVVSDDHTMFEHGIDVARGDHFEGMLRLLREVRARGYSRLGVLLRTHEPSHVDDIIREAAIRFVEAHRDAYGFEEYVPLTLPFPVGGEDPVADGRRLREWIQGHRFQALVIFNAYDRWLLSTVGLARMPMAAISVTPEDRGDLFGLALDQREILPLLLDRLETKLRLGLRGIQPIPVESVVRLPVLPGRSLPLRRGGARRRRAG